MTGTPNAILLSRALHYLQLAQLQLEDGNGVDASMSIRTAVANLEKVEGL